jgi:hypothetical protein
MTATTSTRIKFALSAACLVLGVSCGQGPASDGATTGQVQMALQLAPGVSLTSAAYSITGPNGFTGGGTVSVGQTSDVPVALGGLPTGTGYMLTVGGTASDGITVCAGSTMFDVGTNTRTTVIVHLTCSRPPPSGSVQINGQINICPVLDGLSESPADAYVGASVALHATAHDSDGGPSPLTYAWSATGGALQSGPQADATFTCTAPGVVTLTVVASDGDASCNDTLSVTVTCTVHP